jgi:hypothetical protein
MVCLTWCFRKTKISLCFIILGSNLGRDQYNMSILQSRKLGLMRKNERKPHYSASIIIIRNIWEICEKRRPKYSPATKLQGSDELSGSVGDIGLHWPLHLAYFTSGNPPPPPPRVDIFVIFNILDFIDFFIFYRVNYLWFAYTYHICQIVKTSLVLTMWYLYSKIHWIVSLTYGLRRTLCCIWSMYFLVLVTT